MAFPQQGLQGLEHGFVGTIHGEPAHPAINGVGCEMVQACEIMPAANNAPLGRPGGNGAEQICEGWFSNTEIDAVNAGAIEG